PSHWNTQPWRFESEGQMIRIVVDRQRALTQIDPDGRSLYLSVGAALENLLIAARAYGLRPTVLSLPPHAPQAAPPPATRRPRTPPCPRSPPLPAPTARTSTDAPSSSRTAHC